MRGFRPTASLAGIAGHGLEGRVDVLDGPLGIGDQDDLADLLDGRHQPFALGLGLLALGDVQDKTYFRHLFALQR